MYGIFRIYGMKSPVARYFVSMKALAAVEHHRGSLRGSGAPRIWSRPRNSRPRTDAARVAVGIRQRPQPSRPGRLDRTAVVGGHAHANDHGLVVDGRGHQEEHDAQHQIEPERRQITRPPPFEKIPPSGSRASRPAATTCATEAGVGVREALERLAQELAHRMHVRLVPLPAV